MKKIVIGIDVGISTTKIVGIDESGVVVSPIRIKATDPITSLYGAFGKYLHDNKIALSDVEQVMLTGVGSAYIDEPIYGLPTSKSEEFVADGHVSKINLLIGDISAKPLPGLPMNAPASLFSNAKANASREDIAMGLIWMVLQSIGSATILSSLESGIKDFVLIGNLTLLPQCREVFPAMEKLYGVRFRIPKYSEFCTAIGAALDYKRQAK